MTFVGVSEPVTFHLTGDFHRDIRGAKIHLKNSNPVESTEEMSDYMEGWACHPPDGCGRRHHCGLAAAGLRRHPVHRMVLG